MSVPVKPNLAGRGSGDNSAALKIVRVIKIEPVLSDPDRVRVRLRLTRSMTDHEQHRASRFTGDSIRYIDPATFEVVREPEDLPEALRMVNQELHQLEQDAGNAQQRSEASVERAYELLKNLSS